MKTVTMCGSMKFEKEMQQIAFLPENKLHFNVLQCVYNTEGLEISEEERDFLAQTHFRKIELSDAIYVVDIHGYIGIRSARKLSLQTAEERKLCIILNTSSHENFYFA